MNDLIYINRNRHWKESMFVIDLIIHIALASSLAVYVTGEKFIIIPIVIYFMFMGLYLYKKYFILFRIYNDRIEIGGGILNRTIEIHKYDNFYKCVYIDSHKRRITLFGGVYFDYIDLYLNGEIMSKYENNGVIRLKFTEYADRYNKIYKVLKVLKLANVKLLLNSKRDILKELC